MSGCVFETASLSLSRTNLAELKSADTKVTYFELLNTTFLFQKIHGWLKQASSKQQPQEGFLHGN